MTIKFDDDNTIRKRKINIRADNYETAQIVIDTGNPWVNFRSSLPAPAKTRTHGPRVRIWTGMDGFGTDINGFCTDRV